MICRLLTVAAVVAAWLPPETVVWTGPALAALALVLIPFAWDRTSRAGVRRAAAVAVPVVMWAGLGWLTGWDRATGASEAGLIVAVVGLVWLASRRRPGEAEVLFAAVGISLLTVWGGWQVFHGFQIDLAAVDALPNALRGAALHRLLTGRAFAAQTQPGHLAVLLATVVPLAVSRLAWAGKRTTWVWVGVLVLAGAGIGLTRSLLGAALALAAAVWTLRGVRGRAAWVAAAFGALLAVVVLGRADLLLRAAPIQLRVENWHAALWVWSGSPASGAGLGGFGQAALAAPFPMGNHPLHAHGLPAELAADLGWPGLVLAVAFFWWLATLAARLYPVDRGLAAALLVVPLHNLLDFSLYMCGVALPWAVIAGWSVATVRASDPLPVRELARWRPLSVAAAAVVMAVAVLNATGSTLERAAADAERPERALALARRTRTVAPWRLGMLPTLGYLAAAGGPTAGPATAELERMVWWRPRSPAIALALGKAAAARSDLPVAARAAEEAARFAPPQSTLQQVARELVSGPPAVR